MAKRKPNMPPMEFGARKRRDKIREGDCFKMMFQYGDNRFVFKKCKDVINKYWDGDLCTSCDGPKSIPD